MPLSKLLIFAILHFCLQTVTIFGQAPAKPIGGFTVDDFTWLAGCWEMNDAAKKLRITEQWMAPDGGAMLGMSRTVRNGKMVGYEFLRLVSDDVSVKYISRPSQNTSETEFRISHSSTQNEIIFSNPRHDFPQRIIYRLDGNKLNARIEGTMNGKERGIDFPYSRVKCD